MEGNKPKKKGRRWASTRGTGNGSPPPGDGQKDSRGLPGEEARTRTGPPTLGREAASTSNKDAASRKVRWREHTEIRASPQV